MNMRLKYLLVILFFTPILYASWPTYMHDAGRSGICKSTIKLPLHLEWERSCKHAPSPAWPEPAPHDFYHRKFNLKPRVVYDRAYHLTSDNKALYFGSSTDDKIYALDLKTGRILWNFHTEGPVRFAPTLVGDKVICGSDDGYIYAINRKTGKLSWRTRGVTEKQVILPGNQRIISLFPIRSDIFTIDNKTGYYTAGIFPDQGIFIGEIDLISGKLVKTKKLSSHVQGYLQLSKGKVQSIQGRITKALDLTEEVRRGQVTFERSEAINSEFPYSAVGNGKLILRGGENQVAIFEKATGKELWRQKVEGNAYSTIMLPNRILVSTDQGKIYSFSGDNVKKGSKIATSSPAAYSPDSKSAAMAKRLLKKCGRQKGYALITGSEDNGALALALAKLSDFQTIIREPSLKKIGLLRLKIEKFGFETQIFVQKGQYSGKLPYQKNIFNIICHSGLLNGNVLKSNTAEFKRILRPYGGISYITSVKKGFTKPALKSAGEWTHLYANPGNTTCSDDKLVHEKLALQWFGAPGPQYMVDRHNRSVAPLVKNGHFYVSGMDWLAGVDAFNGTVLWQAKLPESRRSSVMKNCGNMVVDSNNLFVANKNFCTVFDAVSGKQKQTLKVPGEGEWGYLSVVNRTIIGSATRKNASRWQISPTSFGIGYYGRKPLVCSESLFAYQNGKKTPKWHYKPDKTAIINSTISIKRNRILFVESRNEKAAQTANGRTPLPTLKEGGGIFIVCLQTSSGKKLWEKPLKTEIEHVLYSGIKDNILVISGSKWLTVNGKRRFKYDLLTFDIRNGKPLWDLSFFPGDKQDSSGEHGELMQHPVIANDRIYLIDASFDLKTGKRIKEYKWQRRAHGCGTQAASANFMFWRGSNPRMGSLFDSSKHFRINPVTRPGCWINIIPACGLVVIPEGSSGCSCKFAVQTSLVYAPVN